jgi:hypothetical protein
VSLSLYDIIASWRTPIQVKQREGKMARMLKWDYEDHKVEVLWNRLTGGKVKVDGLTMDLWTGWLPRRLEIDVAGRPLLLGRRKWWPLWGPDEPQLYSYDEVSGEFNPLTPTESVENSPWF